MESRPEQRKDEAPTLFEEMQSVEVGFGALQIIVPKSTSFIDPLKTLLACVPILREIDEHDLHFRLGKGTIWNRIANCGQIMD